jgi:hypothetical protein
LHYGVVTPRIPSCNRAVTARSDGVAVVPIQEIMPVVARLCVFIVVIASLGGALPSNALAGSAACGVLPSGGGQALLDVSDTAFGERDDWDCNIETAGNGARTATPAFARGPFS